MQVRALNTSKYQISEYRFRELCYHCLQYPEWRRRLQRETNEDIRQQLTYKCARIEQAALKTDADLYSYILEGVTQKGMDYWRLHSIGLPCCRGTWYERRRKFYCILDHVIDNFGTEGTN